MSNKWKEKKWSIGYTRDNKKFELVRDYSKVPVHGYSAPRVYDELKNAGTYAKRETTKLKNSKLKGEFFIIEITQEEYEELKIYHKNAKINSNAKVAKKAKGKNKNKDDEQVFIVDFN